MSSNTLLNELDYDDEIKTCGITKPLDAIKSDFAKKIFKHLSSKSSYKRWMINDVLKKLEDESNELTEEEAGYLIFLMEENEEIFDLIVKRYHWQFPVWVQRKITDNSLDMQQEDHILYENGKYVSLDKIKEYVKSRVHNSKNNSEQLHQWISPELWEKIEQFAKEDDNALQGVELLKLKNVSYSESLNKKGITISNLNGIEFSSLITEKTPYGTFNVKDLNDAENNPKRRTILHLQNNPKFKELIKDSEAKSYISMKEYADFHFKLMQEVADGLWLDVKVDMDFVENEDNDETINLISSGLYTLTRKNILIPYAITDDGIITLIICTDDDRQVCNAHDYDEERLGFFLPVDSKLK